MTFRAHLLTEFAQRRAKNRRYSVRSFARSLAIDHSTLAKFLSDRRRLTAKSIRKLGSRLGIAPCLIDEFCALENEAAILSVLSDAKFQANSRWLAVVLNIPVDDINVALQRLLRKGRMTMSTRNVWSNLEEVHG